MRHQDNSKIVSMMASTLVHEMVHDPNNPMDKIVPFLYSSEESRLPTPIFRWYLCFMDLSIVKGPYFNNGVDETLNVDMMNGKDKMFDIFCDVFLLRDVKDPMMQTELSDCQHVRFENQRTRDCPLFCRSSPWT